MSRLLALLGAAIPTDNARQVTLASMVEREFKQRRGRIRVLDVGAGAGREADFLHEASAGRVDYAGVDIEDSPEGASRAAGLPIMHFDGINLPFPEASFDIAYSRHVYEHVRHPDALSAEILRVIKPGGLFLGSVSFLEPYHSRSIFNFTPYGIFTVLSDAGFKVDWIRPGIDGVTLTLRRVLGRKRFYRRWFSSESPVNRYLAWRARRRGLTVAEMNERKLMVAGHLVFCASKPERAR